MAYAVDRHQLTGILEANGWVPTRTKGSHLQMTKEGAPTLTIAEKGDAKIPMGTAKSIARSSGSEEVLSAFKKIIQNGGGNRALKRYMKAMHHMHMD